MRLEIVEGDITEQTDLDAIVNAANAALMPGGGVAGAVHRVAGPELAEACRPLAPIEPGQTVLTEAFDLPNRFVIHALGPRHGIDEPSDELLAAAYRNALGLCADHDLGSVGFPAISAGAFGFPLEDAARIAVDTVRRCAPNGLTVRFVLFGSRDRDVFEDASRRISSSGCESR